MARRLLVEVAGFVDEAGKVELRDDLDGTGGAAAVLTDDDFGFAGVNIVGVEHFWAVEQKHHVGVLFQRTRFTKVRYLGALIVALFGATVELGDGDDGDFQFLGEELELAGKLGDFLLAAFHFFAGAHQLEVVDAREVKEALEALTDVKVAVKSAESGKLFGSVTAADIVEAIEKAGGPKIDKHAVELAKGQIKTVGNYDVAVALSSKVKATVTVAIAAE